MRVLIRKWFSFVEHHIDHGDEQAEHPYPCLIARFASVEPTC